MRFLLAIGLLIARLAVAHGAGLAGPQFNDTRLNGIVGWWKFNEGTGTTSYDYSSKGNSATLTGTTVPGWGTGIVGSALSIVTNQNSYVSVGNPSALQITGALTLACWFKTSATLPGNAGLMSKWLGSPARRCFNLYMATNPCVGFSVSSDGNFNANNDLVYTNSTVGGGSWHHVAAVYVPSTSISLYLDGSFATNKTASIVASIFNGTNAFQIGTQFDPTSTTCLVGSIDACRVYSRALSANEIAYIYSQPR